MLVARHMSPPAVARTRGIAAWERFLPRRGALATGLAVGLALTAADASPSSAAPAGAADPLRLEIWPGGGPQRTGRAHTLQAQVMRDKRGGENGVVVRFEVMEGPGDDDVSTPGPTPEAPDLSCVTEGGSAHRPATCSVNYIEDDNVGGSDAVLAWIDADRLDATVEADLHEGENQHAGGEGGCAVGSKGTGIGAEPDGTDCVVKRWIARVPAAVDVGPETGRADVGATTTFEAFTLDQFGDHLPDHEVTFKILGGSVHGARGGGGSEALELGTCRSDEDARCSFEFTSSKAGRDRFCAHLPGDEAVCSEPIDARDGVDGADVVERRWGAAGGVRESGRSAPGSAGGSGDEPSTLAGGERPSERSAGSTGPGSHSQGRSGEAASASTVVAPSSVALVPSRNSGSDGPSRTRPQRSRKDVSRQRGHGDRARPRASLPRRVPAESLAARRGPAVLGAQQKRHAGKARSPVARKLRELAAAAGETADRYSFPLLLTLSVLGFVALQGRIDGRDPKLRLAPLDSKHDVMAFT